LRRGRWIRIVPSIGSAPYVPRDHERLSNHELRVRKKKSLADLVARSTPENLHGEWDTGPAVGKEVL
jgi:hypothetical protein